MIILIKKLISLKYYDLPSLEPHTGVETDIIEKSRVHKGKTQVGHSA